MRFIKVKTILKTLLLLLTLCVAVVLLLNILVQNASVQQYLLGQLGRKSGYVFKSGKIHLGFWDGFGLIIEDLEAKSLSGTEQLEAPELDVTLGLMELLQGEISISRVYLSSPRISVTLRRDPKRIKKEVKEIGFAKMITASLEGLEYASVSQANVRVTNQPFEFQGLDFEVYPMGRDPLRLATVMRGKVVSGKAISPFSLEGTITSDESAVGGLSAEMKLKAGKFPLSWIPRTKSLMFNSGTGELDLNIRATGGGSLSAAGKVLAADVRFSVVRREREKAYAFDHLQADVVSSYSDKTLEISSLELKGPDFSVSGNSKFDFNDMKNPHFFFSVKTPLMPFAALKEMFPTCLIPSWIENKVLTIVSGGKARLDHFTMNGTRDQYRHLKEAENAAVMSMNLEWAGIEVLKDCGGLPFKHVNGSYQLKEKRHVIAVRKGVFGSSTIEDASLTIDSLAETIKPRIVVDGLFELADLKQLENLCLMPGVLKAKLKAFQSASGKLRGQVKMAFMGDWTDPKILWGSFFASGCSIEHTHLPLPLSLDQAELLIDADKNNEFKGKGHWGESEIQFSGSTDRQWENVDIQVKSRMQAAEILDCFYAGPSPYLTCKKPVLFQAIFSRKNKVWSSQGTVGLDNLRLDTHTFRLDPSGKAVFNVELFPDKAFTLKNVSFNLGQSVVEMTGLWDLKRKGVMNLKVKTNRLSLEDLGGRVKEQDIHAQGAVELDLSVNRFFRNGLETSVTGKATGKDISCDLTQIPSHVQRCGFKVDFSEKDITIHSLVLSAGQTPMRIQGQLEGWDGLKGALDIHIDNLHASDFFDGDMISRDKKTLPGPFMAKTDIELNVRVQKGLWKKLSYSPLQAQCKLRSGDLYINRAEATMEHGTWSLSGHVKHADGPDRLSFSTQIRLEDQPANDFLYSLGIEKKAPQGTLAMLAGASSTGSGLKELIPGLEGHGHFRVEKGKITKTQGIFFKILNVLSIQNILKRRMPDLSREGFPFEYMEGHVRCRDGIVTTEDFTMVSPILNSLAKGTVDLTEKQIDFLIWVQTLTTMDSVVGKVPIVGYLLTGKEEAPKGVLIYPVEVKGDWADPVIKYSPSLLRLGTGLLNIFKRILTAPGYYFEKISGKKEDKAEEIAVSSFSGTEFEKMVPTH